MLNLAKTLEPNQLYRVECYSHQFVLHVVLSITFSVQVRGLWLSDVRISTSVATSTGTKVSVNVLFHHILVTKLSKSFKEFLEQM